MRQDTKKFFDVPESFSKAVAERGYKEVSWELQKVFDPYYDKMNGHWCANTSFLNLWSWREPIPTYYRFSEDKEFIYILFFQRETGRPISSPCLGYYTKDKLKKVVADIKSDFDYFGYQLRFCDITPWMLPYYTEAGIDFTVEDLREIQDYVFTPEEFRAGLDMPDDRYRYRYFKRKYNYETLEIDPSLTNECIEFMENHWCSSKSCEECTYGCLKKVIENVVSRFDILRGYGILVRVDGEAAGLCIVTNRNGLGVYQYKNAINKIKGLNEYLLTESFERYMNDVDMINYTEDMGMESLRYYKQHMAPSYSLLSKYNLIEKV